METTAKHIGKMLKAARLKRGLKADDVGAACNLTRSRIYGFEASKFIFRTSLCPREATD
jgi:transcriptional regulator with XRE-family HTH domain